MGCNDIDNKDCTKDMGRGCTFCNCDQQASAEMCEGCFKLHSYDWLEGMPESGAGDIFEVRFKNTRKGFYHNVNGLDLKKGDIVAVEASPGHDIGIVSLTGDIVGRQMRRVGFVPQNGEFRKIYRKAKPYDIEKWQEAIALEHQTMILSRQIAADMKLNMKIGDVEYQGDKVKAIFYYIADERVDFRELIKVFAEQFRIRVEMKQIGARQEAGRIGGLGSCGRELCCASWISGFVSVTTNAARHQEISLNPQKLAGQCGKLKCCMVYELDTYMDARKDMPRVHNPLQAMDGEYFHVKSDILRRTMSFSTSPTAMVNLVTLTVDRVREILDVNRKGQKIERMQDYAVRQEIVEEPGFVNVIGEDSLTRFDQEQGGARRKGRGNRNNNGGGAVRTENRGPKESKEGQDAAEGQQPNNSGRNRSRNHGRPAEGQRSNDKGAVRQNTQNQPAGQGQKEQRQQGQKQGSTQDRKPQGRPGNGDNGGRRRNNPGNKGRGGDKPQGNKGGDKPQ